MTALLIVDDQEMIRVGLRTILGHHQGFTIAGEASDGFTAVDLVKKSQFDIVLMDIRMPGIDGVETTRRIRRIRSEVEVQIIVLTTFDHDENVLAALRAGANAFLSKSSGPTELISAIEEVVSGGGALSPAAAKILIGQVAQDNSPVAESLMAKRFESLTPRELDVVLDLMSGSDIDAIAESRFLSPYTVKTHVNRAMSKVGARDRGQLIAFAYRGGLSSRS